MDLAGKQVLVTGAGGFIGSHLVEALAAGGARVRALVHYNSRSHWGWIEHLPAHLSQQVEIFPGDIRDPYRVKAAVSGCALVFHLAALIAIPYSYTSPDSYIETNIKGTLNILQAARELHVERVIHTSTSEVYGTARYVPIDEEHPLQGQSPYAASKIGADQLAISFYRSFALPVSIVRPFNTYGPRQSARAVIPTIITQLAGGDAAITLGSLHPTRDFNYVADTVSGFIHVAKSDAATGETINIGSNYEISIGDTAALIAGLMGKPLSIKPGPERVRPANSEVERLWADNRKAQRLAGWKPAYAGIAGLERGLAETVRWCMQPENRQLYKSALYNT